MVGRLFAVELCCSCGLKVYLQLQPSRSGRKQNPHEDMILVPEAEEQRLCPPIGGPSGFVFLYFLDGTHPTRCRSSGEESHFTGENTCKGARLHPAHGSGEGFSNAGSWISQHLNQERR